MADEKESKDDQIWDLFDPISEILSGKERETKNKVQTHADKEILLKPEPPIEQLEELTRTTEAPNEIAQGVKEVEVKMERESEESHGLHRWFGFFSPTRKQETKDKERIVSSSATGDDLRADDGSEQGLGGWMMDGGNVQSPTERARNGEPTVADGKTFFNVGKDVEFVKKGSDVATPEVGFKLSTRFKLSKNIILSLKLFKAPEILLYANCNMPAGLSDLFNIHDLSSVEIALFFIHRTL